MKITKPGVLNKSLANVKCKECEAEMDIYIGDVKYMPPSGFAEESFTIECPECENIIHVDITDIAEDRIREQYYYRNQTS